MLRWVLFHNENREKKKETGAGGVRASICPWKSNFPLCSSVRNQGHGKRDKNIYIVLVHLRDLGRCYWYKDTLKHAHSHLSARAAPAWEVSAPLWWITYIFDYNNKKLLDKGVAGCCQTISTHRNTWYSQCFLPVCLQVDDRRIYYFTCRY